MIVIKKLSSALPMTLIVLASTSFEVAAQQTRAPRTFQPEDLFRVQRIGASAWSPHGLYVAIEISRPGHTLDQTVPSGEIRLLDVRTRRLRVLTSNSAAYLGFFNAVWSPDGRRLAFLSVDPNAVVRPWIWNVGAEHPQLLNDLDVRIGIADPPIVWLDKNRLAVLAWDMGAVKSGPLYFRILRGRNVSDGWKRAVEGKLSTVSTLESGGSKKIATPTGRLLSVDLSTGARKILAHGGIHRVSVSADGRFVAFLSEIPVPVSSYFAHPTAEEGYSEVNWGTERHLVDARTGAEVDPATVIAKAVSTQKSNIVVPGPRPDARRLSMSPTGDAALFVANALDGTHLWLSGGSGRPLSSSFEIWHANEWMNELKLGHAESIAYKSTDGTPLTAWLLLPPDYSPGTKLPCVTIIYPGLTYDATAPWNLSVFQTDFEHPQLFAALGYAVLLPSMPPVQNPLESHKLTLLPMGVLPAIDAAVARGNIDPDRIALLGQSDGGFAVLGLITQTARFRSAIASAGFSDFVSLYGTLYGQYRYGDAGRPEAGQLLRMLQLERGVGGLGGPPWVEPDRYRENSAVLKADKVSTPLMLIHGDLDFIPIQQDEEFFTALYRQDKRAIMVRYQGEWHTITNRANVLDMWRRFGDWLTETMAPRQ
jgi:dienelactone hydrolase